ncbi:MAG TPA: CAP domain-containing protein, partial [Dehalococcoidia bacterium]|nr:CAP domain-containing protein [Dehalococcoidia bacterium]
MGQGKAEVMMRRFLLVAAACIVVLALSSCDILIGPSSKPQNTQPTLQHGQLVQYVLDLINKDRADYGLAPVTLGANQAAQKHADDMLAGFFLSHWGTDGHKPYMRYTLEGGVNYDMENSAYTGWYDKSENPDRYVALDVKVALQKLEYAMMYDDAGSDWGHRDNILNKWHKKVNIGIAYDGHRL